MYIDTHCHISKDYYSDIDKIIEENKKNFIDKIIISGCDKKSIIESIDISNKYKDIYLCIGYHPDEVGKITNFDIVIDELEKIVSSNKKIVAIGEIGLDYFHNKENKDLQIKFFEKQLSLAEKLKLPVVIHSREATMDTINCLKKFNVTGVIHCFSGSLETANIYIKMGFKLGIGGVVTFKNSKLVEVVKNIGLDNVVLETDSPFLAPEPYRGTINSSKNIPIIADKIASTHNISKEDVGKITSDVARKVFKLD